MRFQEPKPIYLQIADHLCEKILKEEWRASDRIDSVRDMAIKLAVNPNTVARTYALLQDKQILRKERGIGFFVSEKSRAHILKMKQVEFHSVHLKQLFEQMALLDISMEDIHQLYNKHHEETSHEKK